MATPQADTQNFMRESQDPSMTRDETSTAGLVKFGRVFRFFRDEDGGDVGITSRSNAGLNWTCKSTYYDIFRWPDSSEDDEDGSDDPGENSSEDGDKLFPNVSRWYTTRTLFIVHQDVLSRASKKLRGILERPRTEGEYVPKDLESTVPIVYLDDQPYEISTMLCAVYGRRWIHPPSFVDSYVTSIIWYNGS